MRGATLPFKRLVKDRVISIHAPREGRDPFGYIGVDWFEISIHAPREGRDLCVLAALLGVVISIHAPREGRDQR